jgi:DNA-binding transcriptional ArsR family regulator
LPLDAKESFDNSSSQSSLWDVEISDPKAIRALAHPVRLDLLEVLTAIGPATAARCGRVLGLPQANCSFHLRQLAKYGFVEDAGSGEDKRERQWRVPDPRLRFTGPASRGAMTRELQQILLQRSGKAIADYSARSDTEPEDWRDAALIYSGVAVMTAQEAAHVKAQWRALLEPYTARAAGSGLHLKPGERYVRYLMAGTPLADVTTSEEQPDEPGR